MAGKFNVPLIPGHSYHIFNQGNASENLFRTTDNFSYFLRKYAEYCFPIAITYAYCLMPNHFHFLIEILEKQSIQNNFKKKENKPLERFVLQQFSNFFNGYTKAFNKRYDRRGKLFRLPFRRVQITSDRQFINTFNYIYLNPCHHGFVRDPKEWQFSSIHAYEKVEAPTRIARERAERRLGKINLSPSEEALNMEYFIDIPY